MIRFCLVCFTLAASLAASADAFLDARVAAGEGRYEDIINILNGVLESGDIAPETQVIALANRGVALSLLKFYDRARVDLLRAVSMDEGHLLSQNHLGILAEHVDGDATEAARRYRIAAEQGYAPAQANLGSLLDRGIGVDQDSGAAFELYLQAADQGYVNAFVPLGAMYLDGRGVMKSPKTGLQWLRRAADAGQVAAHYHLGRAYEQGMGLVRDPEQALVSYHEAAVQGHAPSQNALGYLYRRGEGVAQDFVEAAKWYQLAADQGDISATNRLAWLLAGCPIPGVCNGQHALELARVAVAAERSNTNLDSMAAAYARLGEFDRAIRVINEIVATGGDGLRYRHRLSRYRQGKPFQL
jgi:TPR repeat protein